MNAEYKPWFYVVLVVLGLCVHDGLFFIFLFWAAVLGGGLLFKEV